ncbi:MAG: DUF547 domain-containing protein [Phycisphaeraceae bacterium]|nr:DUF547 domain-containing protein [Phycisphaeraceae bacterium]
MKRILSLIVLLAVTSSLYAQSATQPTTQPATSQPTVNHSVFNHLLQKYVHHQRVDYLGIIKHDRFALGAYLKQLSMVKVERLTRNQKLAYYINLYNATMIHAVTQRYKPSYSPAADGFKIFKDKLVKLESGAVSLNDLENKIIRPTFKDPRIHVALVCGAVSCPPLLNKAYNAATVDAVLEKKMAHWLNKEPSRNRLDLKNHKLYLSQIFNWYADDFGGKDKIQSYVRKYKTLPARGIDHVFLEYDWSLNIIK